MRSRPRRKSAVSKRLMRKVLGVSRDDERDVQTRRLRIVAWGILLAGVVVALVGRYEELKGPQAKLPARSAEQNSGYMPTPEVRFILAHSSELGLTASQVSGLKRIQSEWEEEVRSAWPNVLAALKSASPPTSLEGGKKRFTEAELKARSAEVSAVSAELASRRRVHWENAVALLTARQKKLLKRLLAQVTLQDLMPVGGAIGKSMEEKRR
jgi:hypothetical protein